MAKKNTAAESDETPEQAAVRPQTTRTRVHYAGPLGEFVSPGVEERFIRNVNSAEVPSELAEHLIANKGFKAGLSPAETEQAQTINAGAGQ